MLPYTRNIPSESVPRSVVRSYIKPTRRLWCHIWYALRESAWIICREAIGAGSDLPHPKRRPERACEIIDVLVNAHYTCNGTRHIRQNIYRVPRTNSVMTAAAQHYLRLLCDDLLACARPCGAPFVPISSYVTQCGVMFHKCHRICRSVSELHQLTHCNLLI